MPLRILYIFLCFVSLHRSLGNGVDNAEQVQSLIANETDSSSISEISGENLNATRRNLEYHGTKNEECDKAVTLKRTLKLLIPLLSDSGSTKSKTTHVLENLKDLLKNTPAGDAEVMDKIDDLVKTLDKYKEPGDRNDPLRNLAVNPQNNGLEQDSSLKFNLEIPAMANIYCTQQLLNILKATEQAYLNLARNPICEIDVSDLPTLPNINPYPSNPNLQFDVWGKSSIKSPYSLNCEICYPIRPVENIETPNPYPVVIDMNPVKNLITPYENPANQDQPQPIIVNTNKSPWSSYYNLVESDQVRPINVNPVIPPYYQYNSDHFFTVDVNQNKNPGNTYYNAEFTDVESVKNQLLQNNNPYGPEPNYYPELFDVEPNKNPLLQNYYLYGTQPNYHPELFDVEPSKNPLQQNYYPYGPGPNYYSELFEVEPSKNPLQQNYYTYGPEQNYYSELFEVEPSKSPLQQNYYTYGPEQNYYPELFEVEPSKSPLQQNYYTYGPEPNYHPELFNVEPSKNPLQQNYYPYGPEPNYYPELFEVEPSKNPLQQNYYPYGPEPNYYPELFDVEPNKNLLLQNYYLYGLEPNYYPEFPDVKPDKNLFLQEHYGPDLVQPFDFKPDNNHGSKYYYPEFYDVIPDKNQPSSENPYVPSEAWTEKTPVSPYYYPDYIDVNSDKNPVLPYYKPDSNVPENNWEKTPFPYDAAPDTLPLNPIFPYIPKIPGYPEPNPENQKIMPFEITPDAVNFIYPNLYPVSNESKQIQDFPENLIKPDVPMYQYPIFPPKEIAPLNPYSIYSNYPEQQYVTYPHIDNVVKESINSVFSYTHEIPIEVPIPQFPPVHNLPVNPWENFNSPDQSQNIPGYPFTNPSIPNNHPFEMTTVNSKFPPNYIPDYIQPSNQYPSYYPFNPSNENVISPLPYNPYVPDRIIPPQPLPSPGPYINVLSKPNELKQPVQIIGFVREAIDVIQAIVPVVKFDQPTLHIIAKIKSILVPKDEDIPFEHYSTIIELFEKVIEYVKQLEYYKQIKDIIDSHAISNRQKLETEKVVELTYLLKQPKPVVYYPYYYVKYSMPYRNFMIVANNLLRQKPELKDKPNELYEELLALSNVVDVSPDLKKINKEDLLKLTMNAGSLVDTKLIEENDALQKQLKTLKNITSDLTTDEILNVMEYNNHYQQLTDTESDNQASVQPFFLRDKKEADPNFIIGMQRLNDLLNSPNSQSSTFNSEKLRDAILREGKDSVNDYLSHAMNNMDENDQPMNNWMKKLFEATQHASHSPNVMSSNGFVQIDNQKITMNSGTGNRQDSVSIFNPKSTMNIGASSSHDIGINVKPNDVSDFLPRYKRPNKVKYDKKKLIMNSGGSNYQNEVNIRNPKLNANEITVKEYDADYESATEQDGLAIESNPPLKWEQLDTPYKPTLRPGSTKKHKINNMAGPNQAGGIKQKIYDEQHLVIPNRPTSTHGNNMLYYEMNSSPHQIEIEDDNDQFLISNDPPAVHESLAYYGSSGLGMPNQVGEIDDKEQLLISNEPTEVPGGLLYLGMNSVAANQGGALGTQNINLHHDVEHVFPYELADAEADDNGLNGESIKDSVFDDIKLTEKMKYRGNKTVGGGKGVINNLLQSLTGHDNVLQYTVDDQDQPNENNNGLYSLGANQGTIEQQILDNNYIGLGMVGQNYLDNDLYDYQQNLGNLGSNSLYGNSPHVQTTMIHHLAPPYSAAHNNIKGYGKGNDVLGQKVVIQTVPVIYKRPYNYQRRVTLRKPVIVG